MIVKKYGAVPPLQTISMDPHSVKAEVTTLKLKPKADGRIAKMSEESKSIVGAVRSRVGTQGVWK